MTVICEQCDPPREIANAGALRFHAVSAHDADAGHCPICNKDFKRLTAHTKRMHAAAPVDLAGGDDRSRGPGADAAGEANPDDDDDVERRPAIGDYLTDDDRAPSSSGPRRKLRDRVRSKLWGNNDAATSSTSTAGGSDLYTTPGEKRPRVRAAKRATTAPIMGLAWGGLGRLLERTGTDIPVGRTMQFQSPAAGDILDRLIAQTWVDRVLQPFAEKVDDVEALGALFALPVLVATIERSPTAAVALEPFLRQAVEANILTMAPVAKKKKADAKKLRDLVADLDPELADQPDPIETILQAIFAPPPANAPPPASENDGHHAGVHAV